MTQEDVLHILQEAGHIYTNVVSIVPKQLGSRKKITCFLLNTQDRYCVLFASEAKSRILKGEFDTLEKLSEKIVHLKNIALSEKIYMHKAPICSKALEYAQKLDWKVICVSV